MRSYSGIWINTDKLISITKIEKKKETDAPKILVEVQISSFLDVSIQIAVR